MITKKFNFIILIKNIIILLWTIKFKTNYKFKRLNDKIYINKVRIDKNMYKKSYKMESLSIETLLAL